MARTYDVVTTNRLGRERPHRYASDAELHPGDVIRLSGRDWLVAGVEDDGRVVAKPARYRLRLRHPDGRDEIGVFRTWRPDGPHIGHGLTTTEAGAPVSWEVIQEQLAIDEHGEPYLDLLAERDYAELEQPRDAELEHVHAARGEDLPEAAAGIIARAQERGLSVELVLLETGDAPDWEAARRLIDSLILEELEDDVIELAGVDTREDARETWLGTVQERLRADLERFRADVEGDHREIEEWGYPDGRIFASVGREEDEANPDSGHGWMCRLGDAEALGAAGFKRVRKVELL
jgi:hypothetical protein